MYNVHNCDCYHKGSFGKNNNLAVCPDTKIDCAQLSTGTTLPFVFMYKYTLRGG
jgi:hypothetical protein